MVLSNSEILKALNEGHIIIDPKPVLPVEKSSENPFNTTALDLRLGNTISIPKKNYPFAFDLRKKNIASFLRDAYEAKEIDRIGGFNLQPRVFAISNTLENVHLPINPTGPNYAARIEGKSSLARCGLVIHLTAPTIHAGFNGTITLELMNLGENPISLYPEMYICQLVFEKVEGEIYFYPSQFHGQTTPEGL